MLDWRLLSTGDVFQIILLACAYYYVLLFFRGTRGAQVLVGLSMIIVTLIFMTNFFNLDVLNWILRRFFLFLGAALLIIFQPEIRRALAELGKQPVFVVSSDKRTAVDSIVQAVTILAEHKVGALIAIEREIGTRAIQETGVKLDSQLAPELLGV